ncbi:hypothetical protein [Nonomuraea endophytica]|uniref:hypothetical protein n=1 Tax=Nonomuraea endophytica TaxID=714136 RepID=UPI0037C80B75
MSERGRVGDYVTIVDVVHSPQETRRHGSLLVGCEGYVFMAGAGDWAFVRLSAAVEVGRTKSERWRWEVAWQDLQVVRDETALSETHGGARYQIGAEGSGQRRVNHALNYGAKPGQDAAVALCGLEVRPVFIAGLAIPLSPRDERVCAACWRVGWGD